MKTTFTATAEAFALSSISAPAYPTPINSEFHSATPNIVATRKFQGWVRNSPAMAGAIKPRYDLNMLSEGYNLIRNFAVKCRLQWVPRGITLKNS
jgi:hypothetical protein